MRQYICHMYSNFLYGKTFRVYTSSAMKVAKKYGRCEGGETIAVMAMSRGRVSKVVSCVKWTPENGGKYYRMDPESFWIEDFDSIWKENE